MAKIKAESVLKAWEKRGFYGGIRSETPGRRTLPYAHGLDELIMVLEGEMEITLDGEVCLPEPGEEILIPAGMVHTVRNIGQDTARWIYAYRRVYIYKA